MGPLKPLALLLGPLLLAGHLLVGPARAAFAQGNLQLVFRAKSAKSSDAHPLSDTLPDLWCQAVKQGASGDVVRLPIAKARFLHFSPDKAFTARIEDDRAHLDLGHQNLFAAGKYKCEITTTENELVHGNLYVYLRPVFHSNSSLRLEPKDDQSAFEFVGASGKAVRGSTALLPCPVRGYPPPEVRWFKDDRLLEVSDKYQFSRTDLFVRDVADEDEGVYRCVATNEFPVTLDGPTKQFDVSLEQSLAVTGALAWLVPLIVIIIVLLLLFIVIYSCAWWKSRANRKSYNVAQQEKGVYGTDGQRLRDED